MTTTDHLGRAAGSKRQKSSAAIIFAAVLGMVVLGPAAAANADPPPPNTPQPSPTAPHNPHSESGLCNQTDRPADVPPPPPGFCG